LDLSINPNLDEDLKNQEISELIGALNKNNYNLNRLDRIECFDISNISGTNPTGSMVTFTDGVKDGKWYRKFKVKTLVTPNDFGMLDEVLRRRLKHQEWPLPDLLIVDGGKGQVAIATKIIKENKLSIPIIGLAKKEETIITSDLKEIYLPNDSIALKLIMRIRDEAHRFAITYHRKLRSKSLLQH
jgi:excinuclease ABC subunit C